MDVLWETSWEPDLCKKSLKDARHKAYSSARECSETILDVDMPSAVRLLAVSTCMTYAGAANLTDIVEC